MSEKTVRWHFVLSGTPSFVLVCFDEGCLHRFRLSSINSAYHPVNQVISEAQVVTLDNVGRWTKHNFYPACGSTLEWIARLALRLFADFRTQFRFIRNQFEARQCDLPVARSNTTRIGRAMPREAPPLYDIPL
jgi:hypothetical protein